MAAATAVSAIQAWRCPSLPVALGLAAARRRYLPASSSIPATHPWLCPRSPTAPPRRPFCASTISLRSESYIEAQRGLGRSPESVAGANASTGADDGGDDPLPQWRKHQLALRSKFPEGWNPPRKLSRPALSLIRALHAEDPHGRFSTPNLAERFKVSPEAIRRIIKGNWRKEAPDDGGSAELAEAEAVSAEHETEARRLSKRPSTSPEGPRSSPDASGGKRWGVRHLSRAASEDGLGSALAASKAARFVKPRVKRPGPPTVEVKTARWKAPERDFALVRQKLRAAAKQGNTAADPAEHEMRRGT